MTVLVAVLAGERNSGMCDDGFGHARGRGRENEWEKGPEGDGTREGGPAHGQGGAFGAARRQ